MNRPDFHGDSTAWRKMGRIQGVDATIAASIAAGVWYASVLRGLVLGRAATASRSAWLWVDRSVHFGKYWRSRPLVFSLVPRCQGLRGSQK